MKYILAYGSLRKHAPWFNDLSMKYKVECIESKRIEGFNIYNVEDPESTNEFKDWVACKIADNKSEITVDIIEMEEKAYNYVMNVISHSDFKPYGYTVGDYIGTIFLYAGKIDEKLKIESGNYFMDINKLTTV